MHFPNARRELYKHISINMFYSQKIKNRPKQLSLNSFIACISYKFPRKFHRNLKFVFFCHIIRYDYTKKLRSKHSFISRNVQKCEIFKILPQNVIFPQKMSFVYAAI